VNDKELLGKRIKEERSKLKMSQEDLAKRIGWGSHVQVSTMENGSRDIKAWELAKIANVLKVDISQLMKKVTDGPTESPFVLWRQRPSNASEVQAEFLKKSSDYALIERLLKIDSSVKKLPSEKFVIDMIEESQIYLMADRVREEMALGKFPAKSLVQTLEDIYGVKFIIKDLMSGAAAISISSKLGPCILLNANDVLWRQHYSIAHELFHLITWNEELFKNLEDDPKRAEKNERLAECFAAGLLIPHDVLVSECEKLKSDSGSLSYVSIVALARQFEVSAQAMIYRMKSLKILSWKTAEKILNDPQFIALNVMANKARGSTSSLSERLIRISYQAYTDGKISGAKLSEILDVPLIDLEKTLNNYGLIEDVENNEIKISHS